MVATRDLYVPWTKGPSAETVSVEAGQSRLREAEER